MATEHELLGTKHELLRLIPKNRNEKPRNQKLKEIHRMLSQFSFSEEGLRILRFEIEAEARRVDKTLA